MKPILALITFILISFITSNIFSQTTITAVNTSYTTASTGTTYSATGAAGSPLAGNNYTYNFGNLSGNVNNDKQVNNFTSGSLLYTFLPIASQYVKLRRVNNAVVSGVRFLKYDEGVITGFTVNVAGTYDDDMEHFFVGNKNFNSGTDNLFGNQGDGNGNNNNIERVDVIFPLGVTASDYSKLGFPLFERGAAGSHDPVKVAVILSIDGAGNPTSYSNIISITSANYADVVPATNYVIARRDTATEPRLRVSTTTNQLIGGVFLKFSDFAGITNNSTIYGYSVIPNDFAGTSAQLVDYTNATFFPTNTSSTTGAGGIDLLSFTGIAQSSPVVNLAISGNVFQDANGLTDATVNGVGTNDGGLLYVHLVNSGNGVVATVPVNNDGTYSFPPQSSGTYSIVLNTSSTASTTPALPLGWVNTGEYLGTAPGNDGSVNGILTTVVVFSNEITNANFGIEKAPLANAVTAPSQVNPGGSVKVTVPALNGTDPEQGNFPGIGNIDTVIINTLPVNGILYYDNIPVTTGDTIKNYDPTKLTFDPNDGAITATFTYSEVDAALIASVPALVTLQFTSLLPIYLTDFSANFTSNIIFIKWNTAAEINCKYFAIERSDNGIDFTTIGNVAAKGIPSGYQFTDLSIHHRNYYRLKIVDANGKIFFSKIATASNAEKNTNVSITSFLDDKIYIEAFLTNDSKVAIKIFDINGRVVYKNEVKALKGVNSISMNNLSYLNRGCYNIVVFADNNIFHKKVIK